MNVFIETEIKNMELFAEGFRLRCQAAAMKDDGKIDPQEVKTLREINAVTEKLIKGLSKIK